MNHRGLWYGLSAFTLWGLFPLYFHALGSVPALEVIGHRVLWSFVVLAIGFGITKSVWTSLQGFSLKDYAWHFLSGTLLLVNWLGYVWGVHQGRVIECSLGYFINPLVSIMLGVVVLREKLRLAQWIAVTLASFAVGYLAVANGQIPWLALVLAFSFGCYGLVRKMSGLDSALGLFLETALLVPFAFVGLIWWEGCGNGHVFNGNIWNAFLLIGTGIVTTIPLLLFGKATRLLPLATVGILQYITPSAQFVIGLLVFGEIFPPARWLGFSMVWIALVLYAAEAIWFAKSQSTT